MNKRITTHMWQKQFHIPCYFQEGLLAMFTKRLLPALFVICAVGASTSVNATDYNATGKYVNGEYNLERTRVRYFAATVPEHLHYKDADSVASQMAKHLTKVNKTHERLWDNNSREVSIVSGFVLIGYVDTNDGSYGWFAIDRFGTFLTNAGDKGNTKGEWCKRTWKLNTGEQVYLQFGNYRNKIQYQFDRL